MNRNVLSAALGAGVALAGAAVAFFTREAALAESVPGAALAFSLGAIAAVAGLFGALASLAPRRERVQLRTVTMAALFAALCYIGFSYLRIDIPVGSEKTAFHLGNVFCVLAALFLGGFWGGMAGALGLTLADLTSSYLTSAPKTFLLKLCIGLITGFVAHRIFHISREEEKRVPLATALACAAGMGFNIVADPVVGYFYKMYVLGIPQEAADIWVKMGAVTTAVNALLAILCADLLYLALRPALLRAELLPRQ